MPWISPSISPFWASASPIISMQRSLIAVITHKNKVPYSFSNCLFMKPKKNPYGFNSTIIPTILWIKAHMGRILVLSWSGNLKLIKGVGRGDVKGKMLWKTILTRSKAKSLKSFGKSLALFLVCCVNCVILFRHDIVC